MMTGGEAKNRWCPLSRLAMAQSATPMKGRGADPRWIEPQDEADKRRQGYCGAFGRQGGEP